MDDTITLVATKDGQTFTDVIKLIDVQLLADVLLAELWMDGIFTPVEVHVDLQSSLSPDDEKMRFDFELDAEGDISVFRLLLTLSSQSLVGEQVESRVQFLRIGFEVMFGMLRKLVGMDVDERIRWHENYVVKRQNVIV